MEEKLTTLKTDEKNLRAELATLRSKPLLSELRQDIGRLEKEKESILARLDEFHGHDSSAQVSPEKRAEVEREWKRWQRQVNMRRRICRDMWMKCSEVVPEGMTREELWVCLFFFFVQDPFPQGRDKHLSKDIEQESLGLEGDCKW